MHVGPIKKELPTCPHPGCLLPRGANCTDDSVMSWTLKVHTFRRKASSIFLLREAKGNPLGGLSVLSHQPLRGCQRPHPPLCNHRRLFPLAESLTLKDLASCLEALGARHNTGRVPELFLFYISDLV